MTYRTNVLWEPNPGPQTAFFTTQAREVLYGGAVGGGKTEALIVLPLTRYWHPKHQGIILRRESKFLRELIDRQKQLYPLIDPGAKWYESKDKHYWEWSSGAKTWMGYAENEPDIEKFKTLEFDLVEFEELTEFTKYQYQFMFSRNRTKDAKALPIQIRAATNPGGPGMPWVFDRFIDEEKGNEPWTVRNVWVEHEMLKKPVNVTRQYIPSTVRDNPKLGNVEQYIAGIAQEKGHMAEAYLQGIWGAFRGQYFPKDPEFVEPRILVGEPYYVIRTMDYGWTEPLCVLWLVVYPNIPRVDVAAEIYGTKITTDSLVHQVKSIEKQHGWQGKIMYSVMSPNEFKPEGGRPGEQNIPNELATQGVWFERANNRRIAGWSRIALLIERGTLKQWHGRCPNLRRTLTKLPRDKTKPNDVQRNNVEDHAAESLRYGVMSYWENLAEGSRRANTAESLPKQQPQRDPNVGPGNILRIPRRDAFDDFGLSGWH